MTKMMTSEGQPSIDAVAMHRIGRVVLIRGAEATLKLKPTQDQSGDRAPTVGSLIGIVGTSFKTVGLVSEVSSNGGDGNSFDAIVDLVGEIDTAGSGEFRRGVKRYPLVGDPVEMLDQKAVREIFRADGPSSMRVGSLHNSGQDAFLNAAEMLSKHFAVVGTTGVGKSSGVAVLLQALLDHRRDLRVFLIDAHNEYGSCFEGPTLALTPSTFRLPFWLFNFDELLEVLYGGRAGSLSDEVEILSDLVPDAKRIYASSNRDELMRNSSGVSFSVDTPVPYRMADLCRLIEDRMGKLEYQGSRSVHRKLLRRLQSVSRDARYAFVFEAANVGGDTMAAVLKQVLPDPSEDHRMTIMQLAGIPSEATNAVVSVLGRMAFDFGVWSDGALPLLFVCEEAHRYAPGNPKSGFVAPQRSISRIAKEGRKYGVFLGLVSQRPAELDPTILSQCSTLFVMRLANEADQAIICAAVSDAGSTLLDFVPSLGTREVFVFGEGVRMPTRFEWSELPAQRRPKAETANIERNNAGIGDDFYEQVVARWRGSLGVVASNPEATGDRRVQRPLDPTKYRILKQSAIE